MYQKLARVLIVPTFMVFFSAFYYNGIVENDYISLPREPTPVSGNIIPYRIKGIYFYLTEKQKELLYIIWGTEAVSLAICVICIVTSGYNKKNLDKRS